MSTPLPLFDATPVQIDRVVAVFYAQVRRDPVLGPVFANHVTDWPAHEARIARFWRNAILREGGFDGNPMRAHRAAGDVTEAHFPRWLALFDEVLARNTPPEIAPRWSALAHRIGRGLSLGVRETAPGGVPNLR